MIENDKLRAQVDRLRADMSLARTTARATGARLCERIADLERIIYWALGESPEGLPEFGMRPDGAGPYYWRKTLRALLNNQNEGGDNNDDVQLPRLQEREQTTVPSTSSRDVNEGPGQPGETPEQRYETLMHSAQISDPGPSIDSAAGDQDGQAAIGDTDPGHKPGRVPPAAPPGAGGRIDSAFHRVACQQRDTAWRENKRMRARLDRAVKFLDGDATVFETIAEKSKEQPAKMVAGVRAQVLHDFLAEIKEECS